LKQKQHAILVVSSLLTILLTTFHHAQDVVYTLAPGRLSNLTVILVLAVWLYATLMLTERRSGYVIVLLLSLLASALPVIHMTGSSGITAGIAKFSRRDAFFFVWTLHAVGVTGLFSVVLSARELWSLRRGARGRLASRSST
jgi:hypothetical protein